MRSEKVLHRTLKVAKVWARIFRHCSLNLGRLSSQVRNRADLARIDSLGEEMRIAIERDPTSAAKYVDYDYWIPFNVARVGALSLHDSPPLRILDIGCGPGYFLAACRALNHQCYGVDVPAHVASSIENRVYHEVLASLSCDNFVSPLAIERFVPMPVSQHDLDAITAFWICFNRHRQSDEWGASEWQFFLDDSVSHLREGGILHLELNANPERYGSLRWYDGDTLEVFRSLGTVQRNIVRIHRRNKPQA